MQYRKLSHKTMNTGIDKNNTTTNQFSTNELLESIIN